MKNCVCGFSEYTLQVHHLLWLAKSIGLHKIIEVEGMKADERNPGDGEECIFDYVWVNQ